jgi:hypothetical protein
LRWARGRRRHDVIEAQQTSFRVLRRSRAPWGMMKSSSWYSRFAAKYTRFS